MKRILILLLLIGTATSFAANDTVINPPNNPVNVKVVSGGVTVAAVGAAHVAASQVTTSGSAGTLIIARSTRLGCLIRNLDSSINVYIGPATVTTANGMLLKPGESVVVTAVTLWQVIAASGTPVVAVLDEYN